MRIGIDATPMFLQKAGIGEYTHQLIAHLAAIDGDNEYVLYSSAPGRGQRAGWGDNFRVVEGWKPAIRWRAFRDGVDIYHGTNYRLQGRGRCGSVLTIHDLVAERFPHVVRRGRASKKTRRMARVASAIIVGSRSTAADLVDLFGVPPEKVEVIPYGVSEEFCPFALGEGPRDIESRYGIQRPFILSVGTIEPRKNFPALLRAFALSAGLRARYSLVLAGAVGWGHSEVIAITHSLGLADRVRVLGYVAREDLRALYCLADIFVYPSLYEGFGLPVLEAMACGTPVIASNRSSLPEVVGEAGVLVDPEDLGGIASAIERLVEDRALREAMRTRAIERAKLFSWETHARKSLGLYRRLYEA